MDRKTILMLAKSGAMSAYSHRGAEIKMVDGEDGEGNTITVYASTDAEDRVGDVINQAGWELGDFKANPVVPYAHNYDGPIVARAANLEAMVQTPSGSMGLKMDLVFDTKLPFGATVYRQFKEGFLRGVSVGFRPLKIIHRSNLADNHPAKGESGFYIERASLLELSIAPVPANQEALALRALATKNTSKDELQGKVLALLQGDVAVRATILGLIDAHTDSLPSNDEQDGSELTAKQIEERNFWAALATTGTEE